MRTLALVLSLSLAAPTLLVASPEQAPLRSAADREARSLAASLAQPQSDAPAAKDSSWISRHPALFGALVGAAAGTVASLVMENELFCSGGDEDCLFHGGGRALIGAGMGAGVGALAGWIAGAARNDRKTTGRQITTSPDRRIQTVRVRP